MKRIIIISIVLGGLLISFQWSSACSLDFTGSPTSDKADIYATRIDITFQPVVSSECIVMRTVWSLDGQEIFSEDSLQEFSYNFQDAGNYRLQCRIETATGETFQKTRAIHLEETIQINLTPSTGCSVHGPTGLLDTGIHCGPKDGETLCHEIYPQNMIVSMKCHPLPGYFNTGWTMNGKTVDAPFPESTSEIMLNWKGSNEPEQGECNELSSTCYTLTIKKDGPGNGRIVGSGIDCGEDCVSRYAKGASLKLQAIADQRSEFLQWRVNGRGGVKSVLHIYDDTTVTAVFSQRANRKPLFAEEPAPQHSRYYRHQVQTRDPDGDRVSYRLVNAPENMNISPYGEITWLPKREQLGEYTITIKADDGRGGIAQQVLKLTITEETFSHAEIGFLDAFDLEQGMSFEDSSLLNLRSGTATWFESILLPQTIQGEELLLSFPESAQFFYTLTKSEIIFRPLLVLDREVSLLKNMAYEDVDAMQIEEASFFDSERGFSVDENDTVLLKINTGQVFKIGNFSYDSDPQKLFVHFDYMELLLKGEAK